MKINYLFPHRFKAIGWIILLPSVVLGLFSVLTQYHPGFLDHRVFTVWDDQLFEDTKVLTLTSNNILNEITGILIIVGGILVAFSKEKLEDEFMAKVRLESLVWATYINYFILFLGLILVHGFGFLWFMVFNMFTILLIFIIRFHYAIYNLNRTSGYEE